MRLPEADSRGGNTVTARNPTYDTLTMLDPVEQVQTDLFISASRQLRSGALRTTEDNTASFTPESNRNPCQAERGSGAHAAAHTQRRTRSGAHAAAHTQRRTRSGAHAAAHTQRRTRSGAHAAAHTQRRTRSGAPLRRKSFQRGRPGERPIKDAPIKTGQEGRVGQPPYVDLKQSSSGRHWRRLTGWMARCVQEGVPPQTTWENHREPGEQRRTSDNQENHREPGEPGMVNRLFSRSRLSDIKDLVQHVKQSRRLLNLKRRKKNLQGLMAQTERVNTHPSKVRSGKNEDKLQPTLEKLLKDKKHLAAFHTFLRSEFSEENMDFWLACEDFKASASSDDLHQKAEKIYREFIQPVAPREINVDHHIREKIRACLGNPGISCFDEAQKHVYLLMERDSCPRFLQSEAYLSLQHKSRTLWYI
ncbi:uncharacterized protein [Antennarius striatus]|uniref:uncharacterized protein n=1 Tax=Antennarius striatus TaxID=241820 RepID=UPI0035AE87F7